MRKIVEFITGRRSAWAVALIGLLLTWPQTVTDGRTEQAVDSAVAESEVQTATGVAAP